MASPNFRLLPLVGFLIPVLALFFFTGCGGGSASKKRDSRSVSSTQVQKSADTPIIVVLPFRDGTKFKTSQEQNICFLTHQVFNAGNVVPGSGLRIAEIFRSELEEGSIYRVVPKWRLNEEIFKSKNNLNDDYSLDLARKLGNAVSADTVLMGVVMRFERREGSGVAATKSASVAFSWMILNVHTGEIWWANRFEKSQEPLLSNLLDAGSFFKGGMKWQNAEEMAEIGIESMMPQFPVFTKRP